MPRKKNGQGQPANGTPGGESTAGYFRKVFRENPKWLKERSNEEVLRRWLDDHPGETEVPNNVKVGLQNIKGILRSKGRRSKVAPRLAEPLEQAVEVMELASANPNADLESLEARIDDALLLARGLARDDLDNVIRQLRSARNELVWKLGQ